MCFQGFRLFATGFLCHAADPDGPRMVERSQGSRTAPIAQPPYLPPEGRSIISLKDLGFWRGLSVVREVVSVFTYAVEFLLYGHTVKGG
jgi:hypothetical protein